jgi:transposase
VLQYHFNWKTLSAMAGVTWWNFYFRLFEGSIRSPQVVEFLSHLLRHIPGKLLVIWDGLKCHRSRLTWDFIREQQGRIWLEFLPAYAPELNPVEYLWGYLALERDEDKIRRWKRERWPELKKKPNTKAGPSSSSMKVD